MKSQDDPMKSIPPLNHHQVPHNMHSNGLKPHKSPLNIPNQFPLKYPDSHEIPKKSYNIQILSHEIP